MTKFEYLEDVATADIAFKAQGNNLNELFENCALATSEVMIDTKSLKQKTTKTINLEDKNIEQLLFLFLSEIIYLKDAELLFFSKFKVEIKGFKLKAKLYGEEFNDKIVFRNDVKAMTLCMLKIEKKEKYYATVVLDI